MSEDKYQNFRRVLHHKKYAQDMLDTFMMKNPEYDRKKVAKKIINIVSEKMAKNNSTVKIADTEISIKDFDKLVLDNKLIVTGSGSLYYPQSVKTNIAADMIQFLLDERSVQKKLKFKYLDQGDKDKAKLYDSNQLTYKLLNNSFFGVRIQKNSIFYDPYTGHSITATGQDIITTAVNIFEKALGNNIYFWDLDSVIVYIKNIANEWTESDETYGIKFDRIKSVDNVLEYLLKFMDEYNSEDKEFIRDLLLKLDSNVVNYIYYKNNLIEFFKDSNVMDLLLSRLLGRHDFLDPNKPPKDMVSDLDSLWAIVRRFVFYNYQDYKRYSNMKRKRKAVLTIDTDSNFRAPRCA